MDEPLFGTVADGRGCVPLRQIPG